MKNILLFVLIYLPFFVSAQSGATHTNGARSNGVSNASVGFSDINSLFNNQAGLADLEKMGVITSGERRFLLADINSIAAGFAMPTNSGTFGMGVHYFGFDLYNESKIGLTYARRLFEKVAVGVQFDVLNTQIAEFGSKTLFTFEVGLQAELIENFTVGMHLYNPVRLEIVEDEFLPSIFRLGGTYTASSKLLLHAELEKDLDFPFSFKSGLEYQLVQELWVRVGVSTNPTAMSFGVGYQLGSGLRIDFASNYHQDLGFSPSLGVGFDFGK